MFAWTEGSTEGASGDSICDSAGECSPDSRAGRPGFELTTNQTAELSVRLDVGPVTEAIEVTGATPLPDTQTANQAVALSTQMVEELPNVSRNLYSLFT